MWSPKKIKHRKFQKRVQLSSQVATSGFQPHLGDFGIIATTPSQLTSRQQEAGRRVLARYIKKVGRVYMTVFPHISRTQHANGTKLGKGKGAVLDYVAVIRPGMIVYEVSGPKEVCIQALKAVAYKMPFKTKIISA